MFSSISIKEKISFTKNLALLIENGIPVNEGLAMLSEQYSPRFATVIDRIIAGIESGESTSNAFKKEEKIFGSIYVSLLKAGETSGSLDDSLIFLSKWLERDNDIKGDIKRATLYPKIIFTLTGLLSGGLATFILPRLVPLFDSLQVDLPLSTRIVLAVSLFLQQYWLPTLVAVIALVAGFVFVYKIKVVKRAFEAVYMKMPFIGGLIKDYQLALFAQTFSTLYKNGVSVNDALLLCATVMTNQQYVDSLWTIHGLVETGTPMSESMRSFEHLYPKNVINIILVGEKTGRLGETVASLAEYYTKQIKEKTKKLPTVIEPVMLVGVGVIVGFVAISIISPIYELTGNLQ